jgi:hypothetical protein
MLDDVAWTFPECPKSACDRDGVTSPCGAAPRLTDRPRLVLAAVASVGEAYSRALAARP